MAHTSREWQRRQVLENVAAAAGPEGRGSSFSARDAITAGICRQRSSTVSQLRVSIAGFPVGRADEVSTALREAEKDMDPSSVSACVAAAGLVWGPGVSSLEALKVWLFVPVIGLGLLAPPPKLASAYRV